MFFISSMTIVLSIKGGSSPISVGCADSPKAAVTLQLVGWRSLRVSLIPVPDVDAPLSMTTRCVLWDIDITVCPVVETSNRFSDGFAFLIAGDASLRILSIDRRGERVGDDD